MRTNSVFIVDSDPFSARKFRIHLEALNFEVTYFANGFDMMNHMADRPSLIILANELGEQNNGLDYLRRVKEIDRSIPVLFLLSQNNLSMAVHALSLGAFFYIEKINATFESLKNIIYDLDLEKKRKYWNALRNFRQGVFSLYGF